MEKLEEQYYCYINDAPLVDHELYPVNWNLSQDTKITPSSEYYHKSSDAVAIAGVNACFKGMLNGGNTHIFSRRDGSKKTTLKFLEKIRDSSTKLEKIRDNKRQVIVAKPRKKTAGKLRSQPSFSVEISSLY